jgi:tetratricopeptide (TPR) repeat protein
VAPRIFAPVRSADYRSGQDPALRAILTRDGAVSPVAAMREAARRGDMAGAEQALSSAIRASANRFRTFEPDVNALGYELLNIRDMDAAIAVFQINTRAYPRSANVWDSLGEALLAGGRREEGIAAYRRALEIAPDFPPSREALERLGVTPARGRGH